MKRMIVVLAGAAVAIGCADGLPTDPGPLAPVFDHAAGHCMVDSAADDGGAGTLRVKVADAACAVITFDPALNEQTILLGNQLVIARALTMEGPGAEDLSVSGGGFNRVFFIEAGATVTLTGLTITDGRTASLGAGVRNHGTLTLSHVVVSGNVTTINLGGGIGNEGTLTLSHSVVSGNSVLDGVGGGIYNNGTATLSHTTVSGNFADEGGGIHNTGTMEIVDGTVAANTAGEGGGIYNERTLVLSHSTVSGNTASRGGGVISTALANATILNTTLSGNTASSMGGGVFNWNSTTRIVHSTITGNRSPNGGGANTAHTPIVVLGSLIVGNTADGSTANDVASITSHGFNSLGHNLIGAAGNNIDFDEAFGEAGDQTGVADPGLASLADNGGPTRTHALLPHSPAIDAGVCLDHDGAPVDTDQRGVSRPQGAACDIGAFELARAEATGPAELLVALIDLASGTDGLPRGALNALAEVQRHLNAGRLQPACNGLRGFVALVRANARRRIDPAAAAALIAAVEALDARLDC